MPVAVTIEIKYCEKCMQITKHKIKNFKYPKEKIEIECLGCGEIKINGENNEGS